AEELQRQAFASLAAQLVWEASCALDHGRPYAELIAFARELSPGVRRTRPYLKVAVKRMLHEVRGGGDRDVAPRAGDGPWAGERPAISLIVCTRNRGGLLAACLASLRQIASSTA